MQQYIIHFHGRRVGAIGIMSAYKAVREATTPDEAIKALYNEYEHISSPMVYIGANIVQTGWSK